MRAPRPAATIAAVTVAIAVIAGLLIVHSGRARPVPESRRTGGSLTSRDRGSLTSHDALLLYSAEQVLIGDCMRKHGFRYWPLRYTGPPVPQFPYAISNVRQARAYGFRPPPDSLAPDPNARYLSGLPPNRLVAYGVALNGLGPGGPGWLVTLPQGGVLGQSKDSCQTDAETRLYGNFPVWFRAQTITDDLPYLWISQVLGSSRYQRDLSRWARCMRSRGYSFASPDAARAAFPAGAAHQSSPAEIRAAVAGARCTGVTRLNAAARQLASRYDDAFRRKYTREVDIYSQLSLSAVSRAIEVVRSARDSGFPAQLVTGKP